MTNKPEKAVNILKEDGVWKFTAQTFSYFRNMFGDRLSQAYIQNNVLTREELLSRCSKENRVWHLDPEPLITYDIPDNRRPPELEQYLSSYQPDAPFICEIPSCTLAGPSALGFTEQNNLILETGGGQVDLLINRRTDFFGEKSVRDIFSERPSDTPHPNLSSESHVFPLVPFYDQYYYHWNLLYLPKLRLLQHYENQTGNRPTILIENEPPSFVPETLSLLGIDSSRLVEWSGEKQNVNNLIVTNYRMHSTGMNVFEQSYDAYIWLSNELKSAVNHKQSSGRKLYISRQQADRGRKVSNYAAVEEAIESYGFEPVVMESLSIQEQIKLVSQADVIMGPHGAGLVNMIYAEDTTVIELFPENVLKPHFSMLADLMGFEYASLVAKSVGGNNLYVNTDELCELLDDLDI